VPQEAVAAGKLREDLLYRLNVFPIDLPPLRDRLSDVALLAEHFLSDIGVREGRVRRFAAEALVQLRDYAWPGNVRELRNAVQRAYVMASDDLIDGRWLPHREGHAAPEVATPPGLAPAGLHFATPPVPAKDAVTLPIGTSMAQAERVLMLATLHHFNHHKERTAAVLGISLKTLYNRLKEYAAETAGPTESDEPPSPPAVPANEP
jgi:two-component system response regulator AtoC